MIPLANLHPQFTGFLRPDSGEQLLFDCPACGPSHQLGICFTNPLDGKPAAMWPTATWWTREGDTFETLTLTKSTGVGPSIHYPCWHGWIEGGQVIGINEATHRAQLESGEIAALSPMQVSALRAAGRIP